MNEGRRNFGPHSLPKRKLADGLVHDATQIQRISETGTIAGKTLGFHTVNVAQKGEALRNRKIPPELGPLPEHDANPCDMRDAVRPRHQSVDLHFSRRGTQNTRENFNRR